MITDLSNTKIRIANDDESLKVQRKAFELGWSWNGDFETEENIGFLYFEKSKTISYDEPENGEGQEDSFKEEDGYKKITLQDLFGEPIKFKLVKRRA